MSHVITIGDVVLVACIGLGIVGILGLIVFLLWISNPFVSGH